MIGIVLSGALSDGTYGLSMIKHYGGIAVVQEPTDAIIPSMPQSAIRYVDVDHVRPAAEIGPLIERLTQEPVHGSELTWHAPTNPSLSIVQKRLKCAT